jgi:peroxiredoxin
MKKVILLSFLLLILAAGAITSGSFVNASPVLKDYDFTLKDYNGKEHKLSDYLDSKVVVVMFIATECPISNNYNERMVRIHNEYKEKGVAFIGINSNKQEDVDAIKQHAAENNFSFPVLKDVDNKIADNYSASVTPEVYVLDKNKNVLYHGRIDDSRSESGVKSKDLSNALDEILNGKPVTVTETKAFGCTIKRINS